ncbi:hypothetical protein CPB86DRAFT_813344 [Serendipita vermifera]|nr:hypothetical protein CPB86DRAFT_813344 [Serendipita vermifera]
MAFAPNAMQQGQVFFSKLNTALVNTAALIVLACSRPTEPELAHSLFRTALRLYDQTEVELETRMDPSESDAPHVWQYESLTAKLKEKNNDKAVGRACVYM